MIKQLLDEAVAEWQNNQINTKLSVAYKAQEALVRQTIMSPFHKFFADTRVELSVGSGWIESIEKACIEIQKITEANPGLNLKFLQIKEKFGVLRIYARVWSDNAGVNEYQMPLVAADHKVAADQIFALIHHAEDASESRCEVCGEPGTAGGKGWIKTRCEKHK
jgi:hypothetical protein